MAFSEQVIQQVWEKGIAVAGYPPSTHRKDRCGALMVRNQYGTQTNYGWEIDHIRPVSKGGLDYLPNLQPLHWENNSAKADDFPHFTCKKTN